MIKFFFLIPLFVTISIYSFANPIIHLAKKLSVKYSEKILNHRYVTVVDFTKPISDERLFVIDVNKEPIILKCRVAHGIRSGSNYAVKFSDVEGSKMSSLGAFLSTDTYYGQWRY